MARDKETGAGLLRQFVAGRGVPDKSFDGLGQAGHLLFSLTGRFVKDESSIGSGKGKGISGQTV